MGKSLAKRADAFAQQRSGEYDQVILELCPSGEVIHVLVIGSCALAPLTPAYRKESGYQSDSVFHASSFKLVAPSMDLQQFCRVVFDDIRHP